MLPPHFTILRWPLSVQQGNFTSELLSMMNIAAELLSDRSRAAFSTMCPCMLAFPLLLEVVDVTSVLHMRPVQWPHSFPD